MPIDLPKVPFGETEITRLISGGNPLCGNSHLTRELDNDMADYFTAEQVVQYLGDVEAGGIDTLQARGDFHRILYWLELHRRQDGGLQGTRPTPCSRQRGIISRSSSR